MNRGLFLTGDRLTPQEVAAWAVTAERAGFESVWVPEAFWDVIVPLTLIAQATSRIRIGAATALAGRPPHLLHLAMSGIDAVSAGRLSVGLSHGPTGPNEGWYGGRPEKPVRRMREYVEVLRLMLQSYVGPIDYSGEYFELVGYQKWVEPIRESLPILVGGSGPQMIRLSGRVADGFIGAALNSPKFFHEVVQPNLEVGLATSGRQRDDFELASVRICCVNADGDEARRRAKHQLAFYIGIAPALATVLDLHGFSRVREAVAEAFLGGDLPGAIAKIPDDVVGFLAIAGTPQECRDQIKSYEGTLDTILLYPPSIGHSKEMVVENHRLVVETFGDPVSE